MDLNRLATPKYRIFWIGFFWIEWIISDWIFFGLDGFFWIFGLDFFGFDGLFWIFGLDFFGFFGSDFFGLDFLDWIFLGLAGFLGIGFFHTCRPGYRAAASCVGNFLGV